MGSRTTRVYASLPLSGPAGWAGRDILRGAELALEGSGTDGVELVALDTPAADREARAHDNARRAAEDPDAPAYLGDFHSSQVATTAPILSAAELLQVAPAAMFAGLCGATLVRPLRGCSRGRDRRFLARPARRRPGQVAPRHRRAGRGLAGPRHRRGRGADDAALHGAARALGVLRLRGDGPDPRCGRRRRRRPRGRGPGRSGTRDRPSPLGRYSIDAEGLTTAPASGRLAVADGELVWDRPGLS